MFAEIIICHLCVTGQPIHTEKQQCWAQLPLGSLLSSGTNKSEWQHAHVHRESKVLPLSAVQHQDTLCQARIPAVAVSTTELAISRYVSRDVPAQDEMLLLLNRSNSNCNN